MPSVVIASPSNLVRVIAIAVSAFAISGTVLAQTRIEPATVPNSQQPVKPSSPIAPEQAAPEPLIGGGDLLDVSVYGAGDFQKQARVSANGDITLPMLGSVHVAEMSANQAEALIAKKLVEGKFFNDPHVSVFIKEFATQGISVLGEVQKPGVYPVLGARHLFDVISLAGGLTPKASNTVSITHRGNGSALTEVTLPRDPSKSPQSNIPILPGDTVLVGKAGIVYVVGDVHTPGGYVIDNATSMTVLKAIAMAQGTNPTAKLDSAVLVRKTPQGTQEIPLPLKQILSRKAPDEPLGPDDIVFVPNSVGKSVARRSLEAIVQTASGIAIYSHF